MLLIICVWIYWVCEVLKRNTKQEQVLFLIIWSSSNFWCCNNEFVRKACVEFCVCRKIVRWSGKPLSLGQLMTCLDVFRDVDLLQMQKLHKYLSIRLTPGPGKTDLNDSPTLQRLTQAKES